MAERGNTMDKINISTTEKNYHNGDALDFSARALDIFHHGDILQGVRNLFECGVGEELTHHNGLCAASYHDNGTGRTLATIKYGGALELTDYGREVVLECVCFHPPMIEIDGKQYAVLENGVHLAIRCPGVIWHAGKWCAPMDQLEYHDNAVWCASVYDD